MPSAQRTQYPAAALRYRSHRGHRHCDALQSGRRNVRQRTTDIRDHDTSGTRLLIIYTIYAQQEKSVASVQQLYFLGSYYAGKLAKLSKKRFINNVI